MGTTQFFTTALGTQQQVCYEVATINTVIFLFILYVHPLVTDRSERMLDYLHLICQRDSLFDPLLYVKHNDYCYSEIL